MNTRAVHLAVRKHHLLLRSSQLRAELAEEARGLLPADTFIQLLRRGLCWLRGHPLQVLGACALVLAMRPKASLRWARRGLLAWGICRRAGVSLQSAFAMWRQARG